MEPNYSRRWDESAISLLPEYLKKFYIELLRSLKDIDGEIPRDINFDTGYLKKAVTTYCSFSLNIKIYLDDFTLLYVQGLIFF